MDEREILVVLVPGVAVPGGLRILHSVSPAVMIAALSPGAPLPELPDAAGYLGTEPPPALLSRLDEAERLFVAGWLARRAPGTKKRPGEGLAWDAPGMVPPDLPPA